METLNTIMIWLVLIGGVVFAYKAQKYYQHRDFLRIKNMNPQQRQLELLRLQSQMTKHQTSHVLHLLLTICTAGFWLIVWFLMAHSNSSKRKKIDRLMNDVVTVSGSDAKVS